MRESYFAILILLFFSCKSKVEEEKPLVPSNKTGEELAKIHCSSCHLFPDPSFLPKEIWTKKVLPKMGFRFGYGDFMQEMLTHSTEEMMHISESGIYPDKPTIAKEDWEKILEYYGDQAPEKLEINEKQDIGNLSGFKLIKSEISEKQIVMTKFDEFSKKIITSSSEENKLYSCDQNGKITSTIKFNSPILDFQNTNKYGMLYLEVGKLDPYELSSGKLISSKNELLKNLHRPVNLLIADLNEDKIEDLVISNFGNNFGDLTWYDGKTLKANALLNDPGSRIVYHVDLNNDGKKDLITLMTQAKESVVFFRNKGEGEFEMRNLLNFPPLYGSSFLELKDIDIDGDLDIIYTNGDNADLSIVSKPYHGIRIFVNDGKLNFSEKYFYPMNGASKVMCQDFDGDGDLDMAAISFFAYDDPSFLFFENNSDLKFKVKTIKSISKEKWLTMDTADFDSDGDIDIVLGSFNRGYNPNPKSKIGSVLILRNSFKNK